MHIHLDPVGGLAGDMFIAAVLDANPELAEALPDVLAAGGFSDLVHLRHEPCNDGILTGSLFKVTPATDAEGHHHRHYSEIRDRLTASSLPAATLTCAQAMFLRLAEAEGAIHGKPPEDVAFHELGAWDSIADIVIAAHLVATLGADTTWSVARLPIGRGRVKTAHGMLPVPAPATARLLEGFEFIDDGIEGERITPTGAAILDTLRPRLVTLPRGARLTGSGYGFGTKRFPGISNVLRLVSYDTGVDREPTWASDQVLVLEFEIDDQAPEDLATGLATLLDLPTVMDVVQYGVMGKKGRLGTAVRVLADPAAADAVISACFEQTTTLGIRRRITDRVILRREQARAGDVAVKRVERPGGVTVKAEMDDLAARASTHATRTRLRRAVEEQPTDEGPPVD